MLRNTCHTHTEKSFLHRLLENQKVHGINNEKIDLFKRFSDVKKHSMGWLKNLGKNGYEHSERLEGYLSCLTEEMLVPDEINPAEIFILLCACYMHDTGLLYKGELVEEDHFQRSHDYILEEPSKYLLHGFPPFLGKHSRMAEAVALVALGHSEERFLSLRKIPNEFPGQNLSETSLNIRKLAALLRIAEEADSPYLRVQGIPDPQIKTERPLVNVGRENILWCWENAGCEKADEFLKLLNKKTENLVTSTDYLREIGAGNWYLALHPNVKGTTPFMAEKPIETFVGRGSALKELHAIIKRRRTGAITGVTGAGGIGKTELARMYAEDFRDHYPGGVFWVSLKGSNWKSEAEKVFVTLRPGAEPIVFPDDAKAREEVTKILNRSDALLIIDNVTEPYEIIRPRCAVLVTTRNKDAFGILSREAIYPLGNFNQDESMDLLKKMLGSSRIEEDREGAARVAEILGGMPLTVEIAAKHLSDTPETTFPQYIEWVQGKVERLNIGDHPDRDVIASIALSLDLLEQEQSGDTLLALFEAGSVCAESSFTSDALGNAAGFQNIDRMTLQQLVGKLRNRSLIEYLNESRRYSMHPLVRQMSEWRLMADEGRKNEFTKNHCAYFLHYAEAHNNNPHELIRENDGLWLGMVQAIQVGWENEKVPEFLACLSKPYWEHIHNNEYEAAFRFLVASNLINMDELGRSQELIRLLEPLFENRERLEETHVEWILNSMGIAYGNLGEYRKVIDVSEQALEIARRIGDVRCEGNHLGNMGSAHLRLGEYSEAIDLYEHALEMARRIGDVRVEGDRLGNMGVAYASQGEYRKAIDSYEQALEIALRVRDMRGTGNHLGNMGSAYMHLGEYAKAINLYEEALETARRIGDVPGERNYLGNIGVAYANLGEYRRAIDFHGQALEIARRIGDMRGEGNHLGNMGLAYANLGEYSESIDFHEQALEAARRIGDVRGEGNCLGNMGSSYMQLGEYHKAIDLHEQALEAARRAGDVQGEGYHLGNLGSAYMQIGEYHRAIDLVEEALDIACRIGDVRGEGNHLANMGLAFANIEENENSRICFKATISIFARLNLDHMVFKVKEMAASVGIVI